MEGDPRVDQWAISASFDPFCPGQSGQSDQLDQFRLGLADSKMLNAFFAIETAAVQARPAYIRPHSSRRRVVQAREKFTLCDGCLQASTPVGGGLWKALGKWSPVGARASLGEGLFASYPANLICQAPASPFVRSSPMHPGVGQEFCCSRSRRANLDCNLTTIGTTWKTPDGDQRHCRKFPKDTRHD